MIASSMAASEPSYHLRLHALVWPMPAVDDARAGALGA